jgi:hypothetical protein
MGKHYLSRSLAACAAFLTSPVLISYLSVDAEQLVDENLHQHPSPSSPSSAVSEDPSDSHWNDIFSKL